MRQGQRRRSIVETDELISEILALRRFAVVGASRDPAKFGNKVYRTLKHAGYEVFAVNPNAERIDGDPAYPLLDNIPGGVECIVTVVTPETTYDVVRQAAHLRIPFMWMQPGSESEAAVNAALSDGIRAVHGGPCIMIEIARLRARNRADRGTGS